MFPYFSRRLLPLALVIVGAAIYANSLSGPFLLDDAPAIVDNPSIRQLWPPWQALQAPPDAPGAGRPIVSLSLAMNYALGGLDVRGYHLFNIAVHLLAALALYGCVRRTLELPGLGERFRDHSPALAFCVALLWLIHPLQTEPVNYITQRSESLMGLFLLLTFLFFVRSFTDRPNATYRVATVLACAVGMACKETMVVAPLLLLLYDRAFVAGSFNSALQARRGIYLGLAATWVWLGFLIATGPDYRAMAMGFEIEVGAREYALAQPEIIVGYLQRVIWPHPLIVDYGQVPPTSVGRLIGFLTVILVLVGATFAALVYRKRLGFLGAWFFLLLLPTSSIIPISSEVGAERRIYLPLIAPIVLLVIGLFVGLQRWLSRRRAPSALLAPHAVTVLVVVALSLPLAATTVRRNRDYRSVESIWRTVVEARPGWRAHNNLGAELLSQQRTRSSVAPPSSCHRVGSIPSRHLEQPRFGAPTAGPHGRGARRSSGGPQARPGALGDSQQPRHLLRDVRAHGSGDPPFPRGAATRPGQRYGALQPGNPAPRLGQPWRGDPALRRGSAPRSLDERSSPQI